MSDDNFVLLTVSDEREFLLGGKRLWHLTQGEIGAVFDIEYGVPGGTRAVRPHIVRIVRRSTTETDKSAMEEMLRTEPLGWSSPGDNGRFLVSAFRRVAPKWRLRFNADLTAQHEDSEETIQAVRARVDRLMALREELQAELERVNDENGMLRAKFAGPITRKPRT